VGLGSDGGTFEGTVVGRCKGAKESIVKGTIVGVVLGCEENMRGG